jgi:hypothetical protein
MLARELTDEDIGRTFWVQLGDQRWERIQFEGLTRRPDESASATNGGPAQWLILMCSKTRPGGQLMFFKTPDGIVFSGIMLRSTAEVWPVDIVWAVSQDGEIVELGETAA